MTVIAASGRVWQRNWLVYRRLWHRSLAFGFLQPVLFLTAMGLGLGTLMQPSDLSAFGGVPYVDWLGPGLLAAMAMQTATFESTYPIMNKIMWGRNYEAMLSTPLGTRHLERRVCRADFASWWRDALAALDQPSIDGFNTYAESRAAQWLTGSRPVAATIPA